MEGEITVRELVNLLHESTGKMSRKNKHRALMLHAMSAIMQLYTRVEDLEQRVPEESPRIQLVPAIPPGVVLQ
jgi:hypothetical protein